MLNPLFKKYCLACALLSHLERLAFTTLGSRNLSLLLAFRCFACYRLFVVCCRIAILRCRLTQASFDHNRMNSFLSMCCHRGSSFRNRSFSSLVLHPSILAGLKWLFCLGACKPPCLFCEVLCFDCLFPTFRSGLFFGLFIIFHQYPYSRLLQCLTAMVHFYNHQVKCINFLSKVLNFNLASVTNEVPKLDPRKSPKEAPKPAFWTRKLGLAGVRFLQTKLERHLEIRQSKVFTQCTLLNSLRLHFGTSRAIFVVRALQCVRLYD